MRTLYPRVQAACASAQRDRRAFRAASAGRGQCSIPACRRSRACASPRGRCRAASAACCRSACAESAATGRTPPIATAANVALWKRATSLGGIESLIEHRASVEGAGTPVPADLLRLSVGIEDTADLIADLEQALDARAGRRRQTASSGSGTPPTAEGGANRAPAARAPAQRRRVAGRHAGVGAWAATSPSCFSSCQKSAGITARDVREILRDLGRAAHAGHDARDRGMRERELQRRCRKRDAVPRAHRLDAARAVHDRGVGLDVEERRAGLRAGREDARIERRRHQHRDAAPLAVGHEAVERGVVEQRVAAREHEAVEVAVGGEAQQDLPVVDADAERLDHAGVAQLGKRAVRAAHRFGVALLDEIALPAPVDVVRSARCRCGSCRGAAACVERAQRAVVAVVERDFERIRAAAAPGATPPRAGAAGARPSTRPSASRRSTPRMHAPSRCSARPRP